MSISQYAAEDTEGAVIYGPDDDYNDVRIYAQLHGLRVIEYIYEFDDSQMLDDFSDFNPYPDDDDEEL